MSIKTGIFPLLVSIALVAGVVVYTGSQRSAPPEEKNIIEIRPVTVGEADRGAIIAEKTAIYSRAKEIVSPGGFINTEGVSLQGLAGKKVILVDFWTSSCINCQRALPYLTAWYERYKDAGLEIIGVHTPEFEFEKKYENVLAAVETFGVPYPVALDNDYGTWFAYQNRFWPRQYLIDIDGFIVYDHIGEGGYEETEKKIRELLGERAMALGEAVRFPADMARPVTETVDTRKVRTPEIYFGSLRNERLGSGTKLVPGIQEFAASGNNEQDMLYLSGTWEIAPEFAQNKNSGASIILKYRAAKVFLVAGSEQGTSVRVLRDGKPLPAGVAGADVGADGRSHIREPRLYRLIEDGRYGEHTLEIRVEGEGLKAYTLTFG